jgi:hypothetical protein
MREICTFKENISNILANISGGIIHESDLCMLLHARPTWMLAVNCHKSEAVISSFELSKILQDFSSHRIFKHMYGTLNIGKK